MVKQSLTKLGLIVLAFTTFAQSSQACRYGRSAHLDVKRSFTGQQTYPLYQLFGIGPDCNGRRITDVLVNARAQPNTWAQGWLTTNGATLTYQQNIGGDRVRTYDFRLDPNYNVIGYHLPTLDLVTQGTLWIDSIEIYFDDNRNPPPPNNPPNNPPSQNRVNLGQAGFAGDGTQTTALNVGSQAGYLTAIDFESAYDFTNVHGVSVVYSNGERWDYQGFVVQQNGVYRLDLTRGWGGRTGGYVSQVYVTASKGSPSSYGVHLQLYGVLGGY